MDVATSVGVLDRLKRLAEEKRVLAEKAGRAGEGERALKTLVGGLSAKVTTQEQRIKQLEKELETVSLARVAAERTVTSTRTELRRVYSSREALQLESLSLMRRAEAGDIASANCARDIAEAVAAARTVAARREAELKEALAAARAGEVRAEAAAELARSELDRMATVPWLEIRQKVQAVENSAKHPLENATRLLAEAEARAQAAEHRLAVTSESLHVARQQLRMREEEVVAVKKSADAKQAGVDQLREEYCAQQGRIAELQEHNAYLTKEFEREHAKYTDLERQLRIMRFGSPSISQARQ
jgi:hypothetical protein